MRLTVLGNTGRYLAPLSGGSAYLVEGGDGARILLDCGGGAREALARLDLDGLDAVVLSHFHFDHVLDLPTIRDLWGEETSFFVPPGEHERLHALAKAYAFTKNGAPTPTFDLPGPLVEARPSVSVEVRGLKLTFAPTQHSAPSFATRVEDPSGAAIVYASDGAPCDALRDLARRADFLLMHTLLPTVAPDTGHARVHATAQTASALAREVGAGQLLLSHRYWESPDAAMLEAASKHHDAVLARDGAGYDV
jgi:ribonuclease BN (tRNA processing enzyme)